jgi:uncharacterized protein
MSTETKQPTTLPSIEQRIAVELEANESQVQAAISLMDGGATVPFIARYRKEATGGLSDTQLRNLEERLGYLRELEERRSAVLKSIQEQDKLTPELEQAILLADTRARLEDLYLPFKPKRRTKGQIAIEAGLEPLADLLLADPNLDPEEQAAAYVAADKGVEDTKAALEGARFILMERFAENPDLVGFLRELMQKEARIVSKLIDGKETEGAKFSDYFDFSEPLSRVPSHRALAMFRGAKEGVLRLSLELEGDQGDITSRGSCEQIIAGHFGLQFEGRPGDAWMRQTVQWTWKVKLQPHLDADLKSTLRSEAEEEAIQVFAKNLHDLLLAAPAGRRTTIGLDPGIRTGVKVAVVDGTGKLLETATIYPHAPQNRWQESIQILAALAMRHKAELISIGNGTASRETDRLAAQLIKEFPQLKLTKTTVNEAGASVYSASEFAAKEFPDLDVSLRGAVSIARRLQDPLAELVKIEPRSIGVGQYQHDLKQTRLAKALDAVVEDCVNAVGVDVNTASAPLLARVSGLSAAMAENIVKHRDEHGVFQNRKEFMKVPRLGAKAFEQAAGFLRIMDGQNPLDASAVHPEAYPVVERIVKSTNRSIGQMIGDAAFLKSLKPSEFTDETFGEPTVRDILGELEKPGRDPRPEFKTAAFLEGVEEISDLVPGMVLEGTVTNVTNFGAFVDVGVHQDGLVHISALANHFVQDPRDIVKTGDLVTVKVLSVDLPRKRIGLSMRLDDQAEASKPAGERPRSKPSGGGRRDSGGKRPAGGQRSSSSFGSLGDLFDQLPGGK